MRPISRNHHAQAPTSGTDHLKGRSRRVRLRRGAAITALLMAVLASLVLLNAPARDELLGAVRGPAPTATAPVPLGEDNLYIVLSPDWGTVTLDRKALIHLPVEGLDTPLHLSRGAHVLRWQFAPLIDVACRLTVPSSPGDTCPLGLGILPHKKGLASVITFQLSLANLVPAYRTKLLAAIGAALATQQSSVTVRTGERYISLASPGVPIVATHLLRATLSFLPDAEDAQAQCPALSSGPGANCMMTGDCRELCTAPWQAGATTINGLWQAYIVAHASWRFSTYDGRIVSDLQPDVGGQLPFLGFDEHPVPIAIGWNGSQWQVSANFDSGSAGSPFGDPACTAAQDEVTFQGILPPELPGQHGGGSGVRWLFVPGQPRATGCLAAALPANAQGKPDTSAHGMTEAGLILHRFGVALAANDAARHYWPGMPVADAYEQAIAQHLAQMLPQIAGTG